MAQAFVDQVNSLTPFQKRNFIRSTNPEGSCYLLPIDLTKMNGADLRQLPITDFMLPISPLWDEPTPDQREKRGWKVRAECKECGLTMGFRHPPLEPPSICPHCEKERREEKMMDVDGDADDEKEEGEEQKEGRGWNEVDVKWLWM